jgi:hypothetical protein
MRYFVTFHDRTHAAFAELIFENAKPYAVLAWNNAKTRDQPLVAVPLDPADVMRSQDDDADYIYCRKSPGSKPN